MGDKETFRKIRELLSKLTDEHKKLLKEGEYIKGKLEEGINRDTIEKIENFLSEVNKHAYVEENDLDNLINEAGITEFDTEALNFGHRTLEEIEEYINFLINKYKDGEDEYRGKSINYHLKKSFNEYLTTLKDHFTEEEFYFFPDILKFSYVDEI